MWNKDKLTPNNLDFLRLFFAILVIFSHAYPLLHGRPNEGGEPLDTLTRGATSFGAVAVDAFFIISGFLISASWLKRPQLKDFLLKRIARIYPGFIVATLLCALIVAPLTSPEGTALFTPANFRNLAWSLVHLTEYGIPGSLPTNAVPGPFHTNPIPHSMLGAAWTISYEFWCYLLIAFLGITTLLPRRAVILALFLLCLAAYAINPHPQFPHRVELLLGAADSWPRFLTYYLAGTLFYLYRTHIPYRHSLAALSALILTVALFFPFASRAIVPLASTYLLFWFAYHPRINLHNFSRFGDFSYGTYLYAFVIQQALVAFFLARPSLPINAPLLFFYTTLLTLPAGFLSWHLVEKHFLRKAHSTKPVPLDPAPLPSAPQDAAPTQPLPAKATL